MTTREVIRVLGEVSIASSGPTQSPDSAAAAVITAAALLSAAVSFLSSRRNLVRDRGLDYYSIAPPGCQKNNPLAWSKYSRSHLLREAG